MYKLEYLREFVDPFRKIREMHRLTMYINENQIVDIQKYSEESTLYTLYLSDRTSYTIEESVALDLIKRGMKDDNS